MADKVIVTINADAYVEENGKQITGDFECGEKEAARLVQILKVATYSTKQVLPNKNWKNDDIKAWLDEKEVKYEATATKEQLLVLVKEFLETPKTN